MVDVHNIEKRSFNMSQVRCKDTGPEKMIRKALFQEGFRYRLYDKRFPGKPDLVFPKHKAIIFINGCFWHYHQCRLFQMPGTRKEWWEDKLHGNRDRDQKNIAKILESGWRVLVVWECSFRHTRKIESEKLQDVIKQITTWINSDIRHIEIKG